jgi:hypothetical protein
MNVELPRSRIFRKQQTFPRRLIDAHQDAFPIDGCSEEGRTASPATRLPSDPLCRPRQKTRSPASMQRGSHVTEANCIYLSPIHIGLVTVEADEVSRNPGIGTVSMAAEPVASHPLRRK